MPIDRGQRATVRVVHHGNVPTCATWARGGLAIVDPALVEAVIAKQTIRVGRAGNNRTRWKSVAVRFADVPRV